jgi:limonene-1,2-epoxide hydrolase
MRRYEQFAALIEDWNRGDIPATLDRMTDDICWHVAAGAFAPLEGKAAVGAFLEQLRADMAETSWRIVHHAETGDRLFVEGVDAYRRTNGTEVAAPYAAVIEFDGDRVRAWRDYIDTRRMEGLREGKPAPGHLSDLVTR